MTDIVIGTHNRAPLLAVTLAYILERTPSPSAIHVIDDASDDDTRQVVQRLGSQIARYRRNKGRTGIATHLSRLLKLTKSDPIVFTDDDVLCPLVLPDWLARLQFSMGLRPRLGVLALNNPQAHRSINDSRHVGERDGEVQLCRNVGATFAAVRRVVLEEVKVRLDHPSPVKALCIGAGLAGWSVGYLADTYCQHIGSTSSRGRFDWAEELKRVRPTNPNTLEPPEAYRG